ncbi:MAG: carbonic anhydrase, partial [Cellulosilyticaceae bacterium]
GISHETISTLYNSGINIEKWLHGFESVDAAIKESVHAIKKHPLVPHNVNIHGLIIDPHTGSLEVVVNGY